MRALAGLIVLFAAVCMISPARAADAKPKMLPGGYLSTRGNQIVDRHGKPVRIACVGAWGSGIGTDRLGYDYGQYKTIDANLTAVKELGFNCIRVSWNDRCLDNAPLMADFDKLIQACAKYGVKVILDHHNDDGTAADWGNVAQQTNGLWYDAGPGSDGTDDSTTKTKGTVTNEKFLQDWVTIARRYAGNSTVIGCDLDNEPHIGWGTPYNGENWGKGGPGDIWAMFTNVGNAILAVDPGALIICQGPMDVTDKSNNILWMMDLTWVATKPVVLNIPHKVVYDVHEYPNLPNDSGPAYIARLNKDWGYLVKQNIAPVWVGEMGESMDKAHGDVSIARQKAWGDTLLSYMNGTAPDGPRFSGNEQPISGDWWCWGYKPDEVPDGCLTKDGQLNPAQKPYIEQMQSWSNRIK
jgi:aryl-phospho-beta-D-glucosidase BglC (GH1 family)